MTSPVAAASLLSPPKAQSRQHTGGAGVKCRRPQRADSNAPIAPQCQSFLSNLVARLNPVRLWSYREFEFQSLRQSLPPSPSLVRKAALGNPRRGGARSSGLRRPMGTQTVDRHRGQITTGTGSNAIKTIEKRPIGVGSRSAPTVTPLRRRFCYLSQENTAVASRGFVQRRFTHSRQAGHGAVLHPEGVAV